MRTLVTGGAGFIGSHIVDAFIQAGHQVAVIDNLHTGKLANLNPRATFYKVDLRDAEGLASVFDLEKPEAISHQAALADVRGSLLDPAAYAEVNIIGSIHLLELARRNNVRKVVYASTGGLSTGSRNMYLSPKRTRSIHWMPTAPASMRSSTICSCTNITTI